MLLRVLFIVLTAWSPAVTAAKVPSRPALKRVTTLFGAQLPAEQDVLSDVKLSTCTEPMHTNSAVCAVHALSSLSRCALLRRLRGGANSDKEACTLKEPWLKQLPMTVRAIPALLTVAGLYCVLYTTCTPRRRRMAATSVQTPWVQAYLLKNGEKMESALASAIQAAVSNQVHHSFFHWRSRPISRATTLQCHTPSRRVRSACLAQCSRAVAGRVRRTTPLRSWRTTCDTSAAHPWPRSPICRRWNRARSSLPEPNAQA